MFKIIYSALGSVSKCTIGSFLVDDTDPEVYTDTHGGYATLPRATHVDVTRCSESIIDWSLAVSVIKRVDMFLIDKPLCFDTLLYVAKNCRHLETLRVEVIEPTLIGGPEDIVGTLKQRIRELERSPPLLDNTRPMLLLDVVWQEDVLKGSYEEDLTMVREHLCTFLMLLGIHVFGC